MRALPDAVVDEPICGAVVVIEAGVLVFGEPPQAPSRKAEAAIAKRDLRIIGAKLRQTAAEGRKRTA